MSLAGRPFRRNPANAFLPKFWRAVQMHDPCVLCGNKADGLDHVVAATDGGTDGWVNRAPMCGSCDQMKGTAPLLILLVMLERAHFRTGRRRRYNVGVPGIKQQAARNMCAAMLREFGHRTRTKWTTINRALAEAV